MIRDLLIGKTDKEKATTKGQEIAKIGFVPRIKKGDFDIEITEMKAIKGGVEVFARAWDANGQIGFGKDGSVDLERFVILNPPILVDDPNGDIVRELLNEKGGLLRIRKLREDPQSAILQSLAHTISIKKQKFGNEKIVKGKIGNTTLTAYPNAGTGTAPTDGGIRRQVNEIFADIRAGAGTGVNNTEVSGWCGLFSAETTPDIYGQLFRNGSGYDTDSIGTDTIDSAILSFYGASAKATVLGDTDIDVVGFTPADGSLFAAADYTNFGTTRYATGIAISAFNDAAYNDFTLNAAGRTYINETGNTYFGLRTKWDVDNNFTGTWVSGDASTRVLVYSADDPGTTRDPKLVVEHTTPGGGAVANHFLLMGV